MQHDHDHTGASWNYRLTNQTKAAEDRREPLLKRHTADAPPQAMPPRRNVTQERHHRPSMDMDMVFTRRNKALQQRLKRSTTSADAAVVGRTYTSKAFACDYPTAVCMSLRPSSSQPTSQLATERYHQSRTRGEAARSAGAPAKTEHHQPTAAAAHGGNPEQPRPELPSSRTTGHAPRHRQGTATEWLAARSGTGMSV
jgi:hypothetical protein